MYISSTNHAPILKKVLEAATSFIELKGDINNNPESSLFLARYVAGAVPMDLPIT